MRATTKLMISFSLTWILATAATALDVDGPVFPPPPAEPRLVYENALLDAAGYDGGRSFFDRIADVVVGSREIAALNRPHGLSCSGDLLLIADPDAGVVHLFDQRDRSYRLLPDDGRLMSPVDAAVGPDGRIYVSDSAAGALVIFDRKGREITRTDEHVVRPAGLDLDPDAGRLYVADPGAHRVAVFDLDGVLVNTFGERGDGPALFNFPVDVSLGRDGRIWVLDSLNFRICALNADGGFLSSFGSQGEVIGTFSRPRGLACDADGHIWVTDALQDDVQVFDAEGRLLLALGTQGHGPGEFWMPAGLAFDQNDHLYVADAFNHRVQVFRYLSDDEGERP